jgi:hypothetical protein
MQVTNGNSSWFGVTFVHKMGRTDIADAKCTFL